MVGPLLFLQSLLCLGRITSIAVTPPNVKCDSWWCDRLQGCVVELHSRVFCKWQKDPFIRATIPFTQWNLVCNSFSDILYWIQGCEIFGTCVQDSKSNVKWIILFFSYLCYPLIITSPGGLTLSGYHCLGLIQLTLVLRLRLSCKLVL